MTGRLPTFLIVGAQKAGTTSLWHYLQDHPDVFLADTKELDFFVEEFNWRRGLRWYEAQFAGAGTARAVGEASPSYSVHPVLAGVPERIADVVPDVRLVYVVRDPIARMRSGYLHAVALGREKRPIDRALMEDPRYLHASSYGTQVERYFDCLSAEQLLVITSDDLDGDRAQTLDRVAEHLGIEGGWRPPDLDLRAHQSQDKRVPRRLARPVLRALEKSTLRSWRSTRVLTRPLDPKVGRVSPDTVDRLREVLSPDMAQLARLVSVDITRWGFSA